METLGKMLCLGFAAFYVLGVLLFLLGPDLHKLLRRKLSNQEWHKARHT